jgi:hypothetical protein
MARPKRSLPKTSSRSWQPAIPCRLAGDQVDSAANHFQTEGIRMSLDHNKHFYISMTIVVALIVWSWFSFFSVIFSG